MFVNLRIFTCRTEQVPLCPQSAHRRRLPCEETISRMRPFTLTSMMFMTPIPPTGSEMAATSSSNGANTPMLSKARKRGRRTHKMK
jgi:hypothetical protein